MKIKLLLFFKFKKIVIMIYFANIRAQPVQTG